MTYNLRLYIIQNISSAYIEANMLKDLIKEKKVTQKSMAKNLGVTQSLISQWCSGKCQPQISQLKPLCQMLKVDLETLVDCFENESV